MPAAYRVGVDIFPLDLGLSANLATLAEACGDADIPVNNADGIPNGTIAEIDEKTWRETWDLDVFGYINLTRHYDTRIRPLGYQTPAAWLTTRAASLELRKGPA